MYYCDVERGCPKADGDEPARDWATSHDSVHDVLVNKKSNAMLVFILFSTEEKLSVRCFITKQTNKPKTRQPQLLLLLRLLLLTYYYCCYYYKFDTLYHSILLERLHDVFGISGKAFEWVFFSYLADRFQSDSVNGRVFSQKKLHYVVPQGSVSGAVLSILYTQPLSDIISRCRCNHHKFADNTQLHQ